MIYKKITDGLTPLFFYIYIALPLVYLPDYPAATRTLRVIVLLVLLGATLAITRTRHEFVRNIRELPRTVKLLLGVIVITMILSGLRATDSGINVTLGESPEYLGLFTWLLFLGLALLFRRQAPKLIVSRATLYLFGIISFISLVFDNFYIVHGFRVSGVMFQPTTMAMFAIVGCVISLYHIPNYRNIRECLVNYSVLLLSLSVVVLSQSRIAYLGLVIMLTAWSIAHLKKHLRPSIVMMGIVVIITVLPLLFKTYFVRFQGASVEKGTAYRLDLYRTSATDLLQNNLLLGKGAGTLPVAINNPNIVSEEVARSLGFGYMFASTHDLYFDFAYYFGCLATAALLMLTLLAMRNGLAEHRILLCILLTLTANALFNIPSIELTSMYLIIVFALIPSKALKRSDHKNS